MKPFSLTRRAIPVDRAGLHPHFILEFIWWLALARGPDILTSVTTSFCCRLKYVMNNALLHYLAQEG